jgi:maleylpyruvate isomerase
MILYDYWRSTSAWRVRIALNLKGIPYERRVVNLIKDGGEQHSVAYRALNPLGQVPLLIDDDGSHQPFALSQSMAIIHYLEERFPAPSLFPATPDLRARARQLAEIVNSGIQPLQNTSLSAALRDAGVADPQTVARAFNTRGLHALEAIATDTAGTFMLGDTVSIADVYLIPQLYSARRFGVDLEAYPTLTRVESSCAALPAFRTAHADSQADAQKT